MKGLRLWLWSRALLPPFCLSLVTSKTVLAAHGQEVMKDEVHTPTLSYLCGGRGEPHCGSSAGIDINGPFWILVESVSITGEHYYEHSSFISA